MLLQGVMVRGLPTLVLYNNGNPLATHSGAITEAGLEEWLQDNLLSKREEFNAEVVQQSTAQGLEEGKGGRTIDEPDGEGSTSEKRGFVSFGSQFGQDDYMLLGELM